MPGISSAAEYAEKGAIALGELQIKTLEKVEELSLYIIQLKKENDILAKKVAELENNIKH